MGARWMRRVAAASLAGVLVLGAAACGYEQPTSSSPTAAPAETASTLAFLPVLCLRSVNELEPASVDRLAGQCDYRVVELGGPCLEDAVCAVQVIRETGEYPGVDATV